MKRVPKSFILTIFLLLIALIESGVLIYDLFNPNKDKFELDKQEYTVPVRDVVVRPFPFETHISDGVNQALDELNQEVSQSLINKIGSLHKAKSAEEIANHPYDFDEDEYDIDSDLFKDEKPLSESNNKSDLLYNFENESKPQIAIVIDDMGISEKYTRQILQMKYPFTASFLTYDPANKKQALSAVNGGFEAILHIPMMPHVPAALAPNTLSPEMSKEEINKLLSSMLARYDGVKMRGVNNHMGSLFTEKEQPMRYVMEFLKEHNLYFLDSKTTGKSVGEKIAGEIGVPYISRDVFLDNKNDYQYIMGQLKQTENIAFKKGYAIAIGHPHSETIKALTEWVKHLDEKDIILVHLEDLVYKK